MDKIKWKQCHCRRHTWRSESHFIGHNLSNKVLDLDWRRQKTYRLGWSASLCSYTANLLLLPFCCLWQGQCDATAYIKKQARPSLPHSARCHGERLKMYMADREEWSVFIVSPGEKKTGDLAKIIEKMFFFL